MFCFKTENIFLNAEKMGTCSIKNNTSFQHFEDNLYQTLTINPDNRDYIFHIKTWNLSEKKKHKLIESLLLRELSFDLRVFILLHKKSLDSHQI
jgi:hypothetical protein